MATDTNRLGAVTETDMSGADLLRLWSQKYGGDTRLTLDVLADWLEANMTFPAALTPQYEAPQSSGFTVAISAPNTWLVLTPGAGYAAGTITLPAASAGDEILVVCTQAVTALTITPASGDTASGTPTALAANQSFRMKYEGVLKRWYAVA